MTNTAYYSFVPPASSKQEADTDARFGPRGPSPMMIPYNPLADKSAKSAQTIVHGPLTIPVITLSAATDVRKRGAALAPVSAPAPETVDLSPRKKHYYSRESFWSCTGILALLGFIFSLLAVILALILLFNWRGGPLTGPAPVVAFAGTGPLDSRGVAARMPAPYRVHYDEFVFKGKPGAFTRWPAEGSVAGLDFANLLTMQLCCRKDNYFVCDSGQGGTDNVALQTAVFSDGATGGAHVMIYVQSGALDGGTCVLEWRTKHQG